MKSNFEYEMNAASAEINDYDHDAVPVLDVYEKKNSHPDNCWNRFLYGIRSIWATKHTEDTKANRELYIKTTLRELLIYLLFLAVLVIISFGMASVQGYYYTNLINNLFVGSQFNDNSGSFQTASSIIDFWKFLNGPLVNGLYWNTWYNSMNLSKDQINSLYYENKLIGLPRMRQLRVRNDSCSIPTDFKSDISQCFAAYSESTESKDPYGFMNSTAWTYTNQSDLKTNKYSGKYATYGGGGYYVDLALTQSDSVNIINSLFSNLWIDRGTRAVIIDFTVYNVNINLFCYIKLLIEFPPTGGIQTNSDLQVVKLIRYVNPMDFFVLTCELLFLAFIIYYIVEESLEIKMVKCSYFFSVWNILDILVIIFSLACSIFNMYRTLTVQNILQGLIANGGQYANFESLSYWQTQFNYLIAITLFLAWIKVFKYISFNKTMTQLSSTLSRCSKDLAGFAIMFFIIFLAFAQLGYLIFGSQVNDFCKLEQCIYTLFRIILGDFDFTQLETAHRVLGPLYFLFYVFFVFFVLFNMFLAIINDTYAEVKEELSNQENEFEIADYLRERADVVLAKLHLKRDKIVDLQDAMLTGDINNDGKMDFDEMKAELRNRGYADAEIEAVFARYDTDGDRVLDEEEQISMQKELEKLKASLNMEINKEQSENTNNQDKMKIEEPTVSMEEYRALSRRVDRMDNSTRAIVTKIDSVLTSLENMEKVKTNSREAMAAILKTLTSQDDDLDEEERRQKLESLIQGEINKLNDPRPHSSQGRSFPSSR